MKDAIQHVEPDSAVTVDTGEEIFTAKPAGVGCTPTRMN